MIAVHGHDDTNDARRELPKRAVLHAGGRRALLWHPQYARRADELEFRKDDSWRPKMGRPIWHARPAGADVIVSGHTNCG